MRQQRRLSYYFYSNNKHTFFSQKNKDKSNDVTIGFLDIISGWRSIRFTPAFSTPAFSVAPMYAILHQATYITSTGKAAKEPFTHALRIAALHW